MKRNVIRRAYEAPENEVIEFSAEQGFSVSGEYWKEEILTPDWDK